MYWCAIIEILTGQVNSADSLSSKHHSPDYDNNDEALPKPSVFPPYFELHIPPPSKDEPSVETVAAYRYTATTIVSWLSN